MDQTKIETITKRCCIRGCDTTAGSGIPLHHFPTVDIMFNEWFDAVKASVSCISQQTVICGLHFNKSDYIDLGNEFGNFIILEYCDFYHIINRHIKFRRNLKKHAVPCLNLVYDDSNNEYESSVDSEETDTCPEEEEEESDLTKLRKLGNDMNGNTLGSIIEALENCNGFTSASDEPEIPCTVHRGVGRYAEELSPKNPSCHKENQTDQDRFSRLNLLKEPRNVRAFTGVDFALLDALVNSSVVLRGKSGDKSLCSLRERIVLTLCKLKVCLSYECIGVLFGVSKTTCHKYFVEMVPLLACVLEEAIYFPDGDEIKYNSPVYFKDFQDTGIILDCTEIPVENSKCLQCRLRMYSHYKGRQTLKILLGVTQSGLISFCSKAYGGRASDKSIFLQSGLLDRLTPHKDAIMVDKGFQIMKDCEARNIKVYRPPFAKSNEQMSTDDCVDTRNIAAERVHVLLSWTRAVLSAINIIIVEDSVFL
ncbi:hypothetical protein QAD02_002435 [Eretmocerus hayati]|uniref:Uncharacterized protein n=1 Tax=Eretmocerus hayati TaxID=131215 RepID=A0ACC2NJT5_9HYME|nr:hypothetical protein QAD02_002435 [Eretmocerus hayati]